MKRIGSTCAGLLLAVLTLVAQPVAAGGAFSLRCGVGGILFLAYGSPKVWVTFDDISVPLSVALLSRQNQRILQGSDFSLWALSSGELQIHFNSDPNGTKYVVDANVCGRIPVVQPYGYGVSSSATAYAATTGNAQAAAGAQPGSAFAYAQSQGDGTAYAYAQSTTTTAPANPNGYRIHIVQRGENLFRISLRYGTTVAVLAALNNIADPARIYVGQRLLIP